MLSSSVPALNNKETILENERIIIQSPLML